VVGNPLEEHNNRKSHSVSRYDDSLALLTCIRCHLSISKNIGAFDIMSDRLIYALANYWE